ncbi:MAG: DNA primase [Fimbriimonadales bacterium]|nr:DNA primase [Fimbriimonadales bacterium]
MADEVNEIRSRIDLADLIGQRVALKRVGKNWKGLCPFHDDRNPSFYVSPSIGRYRCFACGATGDAFTWVMQTQRVDFPEALEILAGIAGVRLSRQRRPDERSERQQHLAAMQAALEFFREELRRSKAARDYCARRGLDDAAIDEWELGYAPDVEAALATRLQRAGHSLAECASLFLVDRDPSGGFFDKFRGRLIFPIRNERGELVAFGGRLLGDGHPKYINSGDTPLFRKSRVLYGFPKARAAIQASGRAVLVEGYLDVIACHRADVRQAVASLGTSLTAEHAQLLRRWCEEVAILYDADEAGQKAADRAYEVLREAGFKVRFALMPAGEDPDTLLRTKGAAAVRQAVEQALPPTDFRIRRLAARVPPSDEAFWQQAFEILAEAESELDVERQVAFLAGLYPGVRDPAAAQNAIRRQLQRLRTGRARRRAPRPERETAPLAPKLSAAERTVFLSLLEPSLRTAAFEALRQEDAMETERGAALSRAIVVAFPQGIPDADPKVWMAQIEPEELRQEFADLVVDHQTKASARQIPDAIPEEFLLDALERLNASRQRRQIQRLKEEGLDDERLRELAERLKRAQQRKE